MNCLRLDASGRNCRKRSTKIQWSDNAIHPTPLPVVFCRHVAVQSGFAGEIVGALGRCANIFVDTNTLGEHMVYRSSFFSALAASAVVSAWLPCSAAPSGATINFTPPLANAKTIQVTEVDWEAQNGPTPGPLQKGGTMTFQIQRPDKFRVEWKESKPSKPMSYDISDGETMVSYDGKQVRSQATARAEWPFPMMGLLNNAPGPVSAVPAVRDGKQVLLVIRPSPSGRQEFWFDPKTHLLILEKMFLTWQGNTTEVMRTEYSGWILNKPLSSAIFRAPFRHAMR